MRRTLLVSVCAALMTFAPLFGQGMTLTGSGYASPTPIRVSPGQITTLFVSGLSLGTAKPQRATTLPLPNSLPTVSSDCLAAAITVQIPYELSLASPTFAIRGFDGS